MNVVQQENAIAQTRKQRVQLGAVKARAGSLGCAFQAVENPRFIAIGLQSSDQPRAGVRQALVIQINRILRRQHHTESECARLFEQGQHREFRRRIGGRRKVAENFIHIEQRPQTRCARLGAHPGQHRVQQDGDKKHTFAVGEMGDRQNGQARFAFRRVHEALNVEWFPLGPHGKSGRGDQVVERHREAESVVGREKRVEVKHADFAERRFLNRVDQRGNVEVLPEPPVVVHDRGEQNMLAAAQRVAFDTDQGEQAGDGRHDVVAKRRRVVDGLLRRRVEGTQHGQGSPGRAPGGVNGNVCRLFKSGDPVEGLM